MKTLKIIGIVIVVLGVLFFGIAQFLPSHVKVERSLVIPASSAMVFNQINDLRQWQKWSPWNQMDPDMQITYTDISAGEGAAYSWESQKVGNGTLTITESRPNQYIETDLDFMTQGKATGYYRLETVEDGTNVTWGFETDMENGPIDKWMGLLMDSMIGSDFEKGLQNLKAHVQAPAQAITEEATTQENN